MMNSQDSELIDKRNDIDKILIMYPELEQHIKKHRQSYMLEEDVTVFFNRILYKNKGFLSKEHEIIISNNKDKIKDKIVKDATVFKKIIDIMEKHSRSSNIKSLIEIMNELKEENIEYRNKIKKLEDMLPAFKYNMGEK